MSRVLLVVAPGPHPNVAPSMAIGYLAAALLRAGHEVAICDPGAPFGPGAAGLAERLATFDPDILGVGLCSDTALQTYRLVAGLDRGRALVVAGGVHATALPDEPLRRGFDVSVRGEGEAALVELADVADGGRAGAGAGAGAGPPELAGVRGIAYLDSAGAPRHTPPREPMEDLDALAPPHEAAGAFRRAWYLPDGAGALPAALVTSRGCPGRCTFCANLATGRRHRVHSAARVLAEVQAHFGREGPGPIGFHDDAFTADRARLAALLDGLRRSFDPLPAWWCESRVDHVDGPLLEALAAAGCRAIVFGVESGHAAVLRAIGKGILPEQALGAVAAAKRAGLAVYANFMLGFPGEGEAELDATLALMARMAPHVDVFSPLGIVVPYPGTPLYRQHAEAYGFDAWWLDERRIATMYAGLPPGGYAGTPPERWSEVSARLEASLLDADFFRYSDRTRAAIERCLAFRRSHAPGQDRL